MFLMIALSVFLVVGVSMFFLWLQYDTQKKEIERIEKRKREVVNDLKGVKKQTKLIYRGAES